MVSFEGKRMAQEKKDFVMTEIPKIGGFKIEKVHMLSCCDNNITLP